MLNLIADVELASEFRPRSCSCESSLASRVDGELARGLSTAQGTMWSMFDWRLHISGERYPAWVRGRSLDNLGRQFFAYCNSRLYGDRSCIRVLTLRAICPGTRLDSLVRDSSPCIGNDNDIDVVWLSGRPM